MENITYKLKNKQYSDIDDSSVKQAKIVCLYFSSSKSPPCKLFLRELVEFYKEVNLDGHKLQIINIPFENSEADLKQYIINLPWLTLPFNDTRVNFLKNKYKIESIPSIIVLNFLGEVVTNDGRRLISNHGESIFYENFIKDLPIEKEKDIALEEKIEEEKNEEEKNEEEKIEDEKIEIKIEKEK